MLLIKNGNLITPNKILKDSWVLINEGKIADFGQGSVSFQCKTIDAQGLYISPGFIDIHTHGGGGYDFTDCTVEAVVGAAKAHMKYGTTSIVPTLTSCPDDEIMLFIDCYREAKKTMTGGPDLIGFHLEGPYFSVKQCGAQDPEHLKVPSPEHYMPILEKAGKDLIRISLAPELPGALELGLILKEKGIMAAIGHSDACYRQVAEAIDHGYTHVTHLYSGMSTIHRINAYRHLGVVESAYMFPELTVEIIGDGCHLPPELLQFIVKFKPMDKICLVTDSMRGACLGDFTGPTIMGSLKNGYEVTVEDGVAFLKDHSAFAGSVCTADRCVRTMYKEAFVSLMDAVNMMSLNPALFLNMSDRKGSIDIGKDGDICIFDEAINIKHVIAGGNLI